MFPHIPMARTAAKLTLVLWLAVLAFVAPATIASGQVTNVHEFIGVIWGTCTGLVFAAILYRLFVRVEVLPRHWLIACSIGTVAAIGTIQMLADFAGQYGLHYLYSDFRPALFDLANISLTTMIYVCIYGCNFAIFWIVSAAQKAREQEVSLANAEARAAQSELERLRLQLNPHFMCNALNAVSSLITTGRISEADHMALKLADFLRASIETDVSENTLSDELGIVGSYLEVEAARVGDRLQIEFDCPAHLEDALVPNFILQPLVENAIKHGVAPSSAPVRVRIAAEERNGHLSLSVENESSHNIVSPLPSTGIGLSNTRARLVMYYGTDAELMAGSMEGGYRAVVTLPLSYPDVPQLAKAS